MIFFSGSSSGSCASSFGVCCIFEVRSSHWASSPLKPSSNSSNSCSVSSPPISPSPHHVPSLFSKSSKSFLQFFQVLQILQDLTTKSFLSLQASCGSGSLSENNTYFTSSAITKGAACPFTICKSNSNVCSLRLDFETFSLNVVSFGNIMCALQVFICSPSLWRLETSMDPTRGMATTPWVGIETVEETILSIALTPKARKREIGLFNSDLVKRQKKIMKT